MDSKCGKPEIVHTNSISPIIYEAERIGYKDAMLILLSVAFGIGYLDVFDKKDIRFNYYPLII